MQINQFGEVSKSQKKQSKVTEKQQEERLWKDKMNKKQKNKWVKLF